MGAWAWNGGRGAWVELGHGLSRAARARLVRVAVVWVVLVGVAAFETRVMAAQRGEPGGGKRSKAVVEAGSALELLRTNCYGCHNAEKHKGGLDLSTRETLMKGGETGSAVDLAKADASLLLKLLGAEAEPHMPPKKQLTDAEIKSLRRWVRAGAVWVEGAMTGDAVPMKPVTLRALPAGYAPALALSLSEDGGRLAVGRGNHVLTYRLSSTNAVLTGDEAAHEDPVQSVGWSPDGATLASGAFRRLVVWDTTNGLRKRLEVPVRWDGRVTALGFQGDGSRIYVAEGTTGVRGRVRVLNAVDGALMASWEAHGDLIYDLSLSTNGTILATASADKMVKIWDLGTRKEIARLEGHSSAVYGVALNGDATQVVSAGADKQLRVWDVKTREKLVNLGDPRYAMVATRWAGGTNLVVAASENGPVLTYVDFKQHTGEQSSSSGTERTIGTVGEGAQCVAISRDGSVIAAGNADGVVMVWKRDGKQIARIEPVQASVR